MMRKTIQVKSGEWTITATQNSGDLLLHLACDCEVAPDVVTDETEGIIWLERGVIPKLIAVLREFDK